MDITITLYYSMTVLGKAIARNAEVMLSKTYLLGVTVLTTD
jgi:hypothetical protein